MSKSQTQLKAILWQHSGTLGAGLLLTVVFLLALNLQREMANNQS
jgi:hypothetical protein